MLFTNKNDQLRVEKLVSFIQHDLPGLKDGRYRLKVSQAVQSNGKEVADASLSTEYDLAVLGDRFSFSNPTSTVYSVFPAVNASGRYDAILPSVVFTKTSLPWTRSPLNDKGRDQLLLENGQTDKDVPTWLTILLLDEVDRTAYAEKYPDFTLEPRVQTVNDLFPASSDSHYSYFHHTKGTSRLPEDFLDPGQQLTDRIETLDIPVPLFQNIAPSVEDLKYMAHIRKVSLVNKPTIPGISDIGESEGSFSIVFGNRIPGSNRKTEAYLVSLESMEDFLPSSGFSLDPKKMVRLAVLKSWTFYSTGDNAAFTNRMKQLNGAENVQGIVNDSLNLITSLRLPVPEKGVPLVKDAIRMGYVPLKHHLRSGKEKEGTWQGEKTVSWYRSPLCPYSQTEDRILLPLVSADQGTIYDPTTGMFDVSYAAAWTLGRHMALQDKSFSSRLYNWKKQLFHRVQNDEERVHLTSLFTQVFDQVSGERTHNPSNENGSFIERTIASLKTKK